MNLIPIEQVVIPDTRLRKTFDEDKLQELAESISRIGLLQLPILHGKALISGERRLRAMQILDKAGVAYTYLDQPIPVGMFPYAAYDFLNAVTALEIELSENTKRVDLHWQVVVKATADLHKHREQGNPGWTAQDTSRELGYSASNRKTIIQRLNLADSLDLPEVRAAKTEAEAVKILHKSLQRGFIQELRKRQEVKETKHTLIQGEFENIYKNIGSGFSVILTDPPYGLNADKFNVTVKYNTPQHKYKDSLEQAFIHYTNLAKLGYELTADQAHLYTFCTVEHFYTLCSLFREYNWEVWPRPLIWYKQRGIPPKPDLGPSYTYECILFANKGHKPTYKLADDVLVCNMGNKIRHAAEKPVHIFKDLLARSALAGETVLDPFCGSGPIFEAAEQLDLTATGIDTDGDCIAHSQERINEIQEANEANSTDRT